ncbi:glycosyltransferase [Methylovulum psychrotolerans]|uniref:Glycosyltransferase n=1 Tax=Methylovulum psychrotolerans TaxID=1704499 RepID=A0A2S5CME2_9GAMM|nr:glycosyltransferase [Methylovulum psychrotolerans]POZ51990.1 glycosyltransferase [Methylovulum psychrotolerans]
MTIRETLKALRGEVKMTALWGIKIACKTLGLRKAYQSRLIRLVARQELFDNAYYLENNGDVAQIETDGLKHYVLHGDKEGRAPMALFDPVYYRSKATGLSKHLYTNTLLHYKYVGRYCRTSPSAWFDLDFYLVNNKDVARTDNDPLIHYLKWGGAEGRSPCPQFDGTYYLRTSPDVAATGMNPLLHYLFFGRTEGRSTQQERDSDGLDIEPGELPVLTLPDDEAWGSLVQRAHIAETDLDVVVPVYKGRIETLRCLYSALAVTYDVPFELVVINDASPDEELSADLQRLADKGLFTLLVNEENLGFVQTVNRGMKLHPQRHVVLLNSDTEVYDGWLDRLHKAAHRNRKTGTVTPLSNNATICSYPNFLHDNPYPLEVSYAEMDALTATINADVEVEVPTGVGFCMYIRRDCLEKVGLFDEKAFGKGYGEENDFCQRAIRKGWRNIIAGDIFVRHLGSTSFQGERAMRVQAALKVLDKKYPRYRKDVDVFVKADPLKDSRSRLDAFRLQRMSRAQNILLVCHSRGGGSERRVQEDIVNFMQAGYGVFTLRPVAKRPTHVNLGHPSIRSVPNINPFELADTAALAAILKELGITEVHTHSLVDFVPDAALELHKVIKELGAFWKINLHDYKPICPRINLIDEDGRYCGEPDEAGCNRCLLERNSDFGVKSIAEWRSSHQQALRLADRIVVPDQDVADRLGSYFPDVAFEVLPHEAIDLKAIQVKTPQIAAEEKLRVVIIGAIGKIKGFEVIMACAKLVQQQNLPIEFIVMGYTMNDLLIKESGVTVTGKYHEHDALATLENLNPHLVWLPSLWPETYSYTLSLAFQAHLPVFSFDIGAIARRTREAGMADKLAPLAWMDSPEKLVGQFDNYRQACLQPLL